MSWLRSYSRSASARWASLVGAILGALVFVYYAATSTVDQPTPPPSKVTSTKETKKTEDNQQLATEDRVPGSVIDLRRWKLTLPVGEPDEIYPTQLTAYENKSYFFVSNEQGAVVFRAPAGGVTTKNSKYPRTELREMNSSGTNEIAWSNRSGTHVLQIKQAITKLTDKKPEVVVGQIHDDEDDVIMIRLENRKLFVERGGKNVATLNEAYSLGTIFTVRIEAKNERVMVYYNDVLKANLNVAGDDYYFKAGCYLQATPANGNDPNDYAEVMIYELTVEHS